MLAQNHNRLAWATQRVPKGPTTNGNCKQCAGRCQPAVYDSFAAVLSSASDRVLSQMKDLRDPSYIRQIQLYAYMCVYTYVHTDIIYIYIYTPTCHAYICPTMYVCMCVCIYMYIVFAQIPMCPDVTACTAMYGHAHACMRIGFRMYMYIHVCNAPLHVACR